MSLLAIWPLTQTTLTISDPSDVIEPADWALLADDNIPPILYQTEEIVGLYTYNGRAANVSHSTLTVNKNDTRILVVAND